jgi:ribonuclease P protein component
MQRQFRLRNSADFKRLRADGRVWRHPFLTLSVAPNALGHNRYGFIVSRHLGGAVVRNRVRRVLREVVRLSASRLKPGFDMTFIARNEIVDQPYSNVQRALEECFKRAKLWQDAVQAGEVGKVE